MSDRFESRRLAIVCTHPIQYYSPWFRYLAQDERLSLRVFYLLQPSEEGVEDPAFGRRISWDIPLLDGYAHEFVPNEASRPGVGRFWGYHNPQLRKRIEAFAPTSILLLGYNYRSLLHFILSWPSASAPLIFRGDSHRLVPPSILSATVNRALITLLFKCFRAFVYVGQANRRYFRYHGCPESRLFRAPHAIDNGRFQATADGAVEQARQWRDEIDVPRHHTLVLFAGKLEGIKRPELLLRAFLALNPDNASLVFVGSGALDAQLRREAGSNGKVRFVAFQNQAIMPIVYKASDLLVLPSDSETWGLVVNEAMAVGVPAIVSDRVGCAEDLVLPGSTGLTFEAGNEESLRHRLKEALADRGRLRQWGAAARARIAEFSYAQAAHGLMRAMEFASAAAPRTALR